MKIEEDIQAAELNFWQSYDKFKTLAYSIANQCIDQAIERHRSSEGEDTRIQLQGADLIFVEVLAKILRDQASYIRKTIEAYGGELPEYGIFRVDETGQKVPGDYEN